MEFSYQTTDRDYLALLNHILDQSVLGKKFSGFAWMLISALAWLSVLLPYLKFREIGPGFLTRAALAVVVTLGFPRFYSWYTTACFAGIINPSSVVRLAGPSVLTVGEDLVQVATQTTTARTSWKDLHAVIPAPGHIFLFFTPLVAAPIPRSSFAGEAEFQALYATLTAHRTAALHSPQSP